MANDNKPAIAPTPWRVGESVGGKVFIYDANNKVLFVPNMSSTGRSKDELKAIYHTIVLGVNNLVKDQAEEIYAWDRFDRGQK
jgi:hypothetical protein